MTSESQVPIAPLNAARTAQRADSAPSLPFSRAIALRAVERGVGFAESSIYVRYQMDRMDTSSGSPNSPPMNPSPEAASHTAPAPTYSRKNPLLAELIGHERLTKPGSSKDTRHFVLKLAGSGLVYTPGDSLGAFGRNPPELVDELLAWLEFDGATPIKNPGAQNTTFPS